jgi:O-antigen/teichoic acid export membrane protein
MQKYLEIGRRMLFTATAKDTFILFAGNLGAALWGFLFILFVARSVSVYEFGVLSAVLNFVIILTSFADIGISAGAVNFVSNHTARDEHEKANEYIKAAFLIRLFIVLLISVLVAIFAPFVSRTFLATNDPKMAIWGAIIPIFLFPDMFFPFILQAKRKFLHSTIIDNAFYLARFLFALGFYIVGGLTMNKAFWAFGIGFLVSVILIVMFVGTDFMRSKPDRAKYSGLLKYSGWIGVNRIISSISGRLDIQMLASMSGALATGLYSIPSRLAGFLTVLVSSFSSVLAPRFASFGSKESEKNYLLKSLVAVLPIAAGVVLWIVIAKPFILTLFGEKYIDSVPVFQALAAAMIPYLFTVPSVTAIIYSMKKTVVIGAYSFVHLGLVFFLNLFLIPKYGVFGPAITLGISYAILAIYTWVIVIRYYWGKKS